jgi:hypothetical protein
MEDAGWIHLVNKILQKLEVISVKELREEDKIVLRYEFGEKWEAIVQDVA